VTTKFFGEVTKWLLAIYPFGVELKFLRIFTIPMMPHQTCYKTFLCKPYFSKWVFQITTFEGVCDLEKKVKVA